MSGGYLLAVLAVMLCRNGGVAVTMTLCAAPLGAALLGFLAFASQICAENIPIPKPACDATKTVLIRYSTTSERLYVESSVDGERGGCVTLSQIFDARSGKEPLYAVDPVSGERVADATGTWLITANVMVEDGVTLNVHGGASGDADELRILSDNTTVLNLRAHGGSLSFENTKVFSWDENANTYDTNTDDGRSYISAVSETITDPTETCLGKAQKEMGESRMDIVDSEMAYLGFQGSESYGLTWKVRGFCTDGTNPEVFDNVNVYGNIYDSLIHDNWFGVYTYGHQQGDWRRNQMYNNIQYGFDPHDDSDFLNIHDNTVYNNGNHGIIASKRCNGVSIQNNVVFDGGQAGLFLHRLSDHAIVKGNHVYNNDDAGLAFLESNDALVTDNIFEGNKYGVRLSVGSARIIIENNVITGSVKYNIYTYDGTDLPYEAASGRMQDLEVISNTFEGGNEAIKLQQADSTVFLSNSFNTTATIRFADSNDTLMSGNTGLDGTEVKIRDSACFDPASDPEFTPVCG